MALTKNLGGGGAGGGGDTIDRRGLAQQIAARTTGYTENQVYELLGTFGDVVTESLAGGHTVALKGFGSWKPIVRSARTGRDIRTKAVIQIPAKRGVNFAVGNSLKTAVSGGMGGMHAGGPRNLAPAGGAKPANTAPTTATAQASGGPGRGGRRK